MSSKARSTSRRRRLVIVASALLAVVALAPVVIVYTVDVAHLLEGVMNGAIRPATGGLYEVQIERARP